MDIVLKATSTPGSKKDWGNPDPNTRGEWSEIYETISSWFCTSHDFNSDNNLYIILEEGIIGFIGEELRYLGPSLRSAASLVWKAYYKLTNGIAEPSESTPGVWVYPQDHLIQWKEPFYNLEFAVRKNKEKIQEGTIFTFHQELAQIYYAPAERISQATVWILQSE